MSSRHARGKAGRREGARSGPPSGLVQSMPCRRKTRREGRRELGRQAGQCGKGRKKRAGPIPGVGLKRKKKKFFQENSFLFLVSKSKPNSNGI